MIKGNNSFRISYGNYDSDLLYLLVTLFSHLHLSINLIQGTKLTFLARSCQAPKFSKLVAKIKKLGAIKKKDS